MLNLCREETVAGLGRALFARLFLARCGREEVLRRLPAAAQNMLDIGWGSEAGAFATVGLSRVVTLLCFLCDYWFDMCAAGRRAERAKVRAAMEWALQQTQVVPSARL